MARGIGTTMGIALVTLTLHVGGGASSGHPDGTLAFAMLAAAAACAAVIAITIPPLPGPPGAAGADSAHGDAATAEGTGAFG
jgi:hypothetical protein